MAGLNFHYFWEQLPGRDIFIVFRTFLGGIFSPEKRKTVLLKNIQTLRQLTGEGASRLGCSPTLFIIRIFANKT
ncbi:MAG TPA: hypothetical protein VIK40_10125, partial [Geomonas sp.]